MPGPGQGSAGAQVLLAPGPSPVPPKAAFGPVIAHRGRMAYTTPLGAASSGKGRHGSEHTSREGKVVMERILNSAKLVPVLFILAVLVMGTSLCISGLPLNIQNVFFPFTYYLPVFIGLSILYFVVRSFYTELNYLFFVNVFHVVVLSKELPSLLTIVTVG